MDAADRTPTWSMRLARLRASRRAWLLAVNLRYLLGFALLPAGLKKVLGEPFTDPANSGPFHDFLDAFLATGRFYTFVGMLQVGVATLLLTQRLAALGALLFFPVITAIGVFCWSTGAYPTAGVVTLMWLGGLGLLAFDAPRLFAVAAHVPDATPRPLTLRPWSLAGAGILGFYLLTVVINGGIYRPRGFEPENPAFWTLPALVLFPIGAWLLERRAGRR